MVSRYVEPGSLETYGMSNWVKVWLKIELQPFASCDIYNLATSQQGHVQTEHGKRRRPTLPFVLELKLSRKLTIFRDQSFNRSTSFSNSALAGVEFPSFRDEQEVGTVLKSGVLFKTSLGREEDSRPGPTRQRQFRLTEGALEYLHPFSHVNTTWFQAYIATIFHMIAGHDCIGEGQA